MSQTQHASHSWHRALDLPQDISSYHAIINTIKEIYLAHIATINVIDHFKMEYSAHKMQLYRSMLVIIPPGSLPDSTHIDIGTAG